MKRLLLAIAVCGFPALTLADDQGVPSSKSRTFKLSDEITVHFTDQGNIYDHLKTYVTDILPNGDLKIYAEKLSKTGQETWKYTLSGTIHPADISPDGTTYGDNMINVVMTKTSLDDDQDRSEIKHIVAQWILRTILCVCGVFACVLIVSRKALAEPVAHKTQATVDA